MDALINIITDPRFIGWGAITVIDKLLRPHTGRFEMASTINAGVLTVGGLYTLSQIIQNKPSQHIINWVKYSGLAYYMFDTPTARPELVFHHLLYFAMIYYTPDMPLFTASAFLLDLPITLLNVVLYLRSRKIPVPLWMKIILITSYFITRLVIFPVSLVHHWKQLSQAAFVLPWIYSALTVMGVYWFKLLITKA